MNFEYQNFDLNQADNTIVIAEIGVNHNGSLELAKQLIDAAVKANVDVVKFQVFNAEKEISKNASKTPYQQATTPIGSNQLEMCKMLELSGEQLKKLKEYCISSHISFLCSVFDFDSVDLLVDELKVETIKVPSGEITNLPLLEYVGRKSRSVILSTGASTLSEVGLAVETLQKSGCSELVLFHCVTSYPAPYENINLRAMKLLRDTFGLPVGFSDHTIGIETAIAAAALGAIAIEKHFTLNRDFEGPDHQASSEPMEMAKLVQGVRIANLVLGSYEKQPTYVELPNLSLIRKSLVAGCNLKRGTVLERGMIEIKRPAGGIDPSDLDQVIGRTLKNDIDFDNAISWDDLV